MTPYVFLWIAIAILKLDPSSAQAQNNCITPENYYGTCITLSYCPEVVNVFRRTNEAAARRYVIALQRSCGTRSMNGDPVICCTRPIRSPQLPVTTSRPNPFLPSQSTQAPTRSPVIPQSTIAPVPTTAKPLTTTRIPNPTPKQQESLIDEQSSNCRGPDIRPGTCIDLKDCSELLQDVYTKQSDQTFINYLRASNTICGSIGSVVCCPVKTPGSTTSAPTKSVDSNSISNRLPTVEEGCGHTLNSYKKIVGGEASKPGAWPWVALLGYDDGSASPFKCGGTLISARHVLTAAHCAIRSLSFVRLGEHDLKTNTEAQHVDIKIAKIVSNDKYNKRNGHSDIALLYLDRNVQFNDFISPVCLPLTTELRQRSYVSSTPFVVGWGKTMEGGNSATVLQELQIPVFENEVCRDRYEKQNRLFTDDQFDSAVICAGVLSGGMDTCQGDSGGPLMIPEPYKDNVRYYLLGVVSYGIGCARPDVPGVYTSTQYFMDWIIEHVGKTP